MTVFNLGSAIRSRDNNPLSLHITVCVKCHTDMYMIRICVSTNVYDTSNEE